MHDQEITSAIDLDTFDQLWQRVHGPAVICHCNTELIACRCAWRRVDTQRSIVDLIKTWRSQVVAQHLDEAQCETLLSRFMAVSLWLLSDAPRYRRNEHLLWSSSAGQRRLVAVHREFLRLIAIGNS